MGVETHLCDLGLVDHEGHGPGALGRFSRVTLFVERDVGGDHQGSLVPGRSRHAPLAGLAQGQGAAVAGMLDFVGADVPDQAELVGHEGGEGPAHVDRGLRADGDHADVLQAAVPSGKGAPGGLGGQVDDAELRRAEGDLGATQPDAVLVRVDAAERREFFHRHGQWRQVESYGGDARVDLGHFVLPR